MSEAIVPYESVKDRSELLAQLREIFFEASTKKDFEDETQKENFYQKYLGYYLTHYPDLAWIALDERVLGYVVASPESTSLELLNHQGHLKIFESYFEKYPAHLHINCNSESRGKGVGTKLIKKVFSELSSRDIHGLHIMTGPVSPNRAFYKKLGFNFEVEESFKGSPILFMGKTL